MKSPTKQESIAIFQACSPTLGLCLIVRLRFCAPGITNQQQQKHEETLLKTISGAFYAHFLVDNLSTLQWISLMLALVLGFILQPL